VIARLRLGRYPAKRFGAIQYAKELDLPKRSIRLWRATHVTSGRRIFFCETRSILRPNTKEAQRCGVRHVAGPELLEGVRQYALKEFGPMALSVLSHWGVARCEDIGHMVFNLIGAGIFGKTDEDSMDDFKAVYDFRDAFVKPFQPEPALPARNCH
jgi:uncharacterized repeat protein (TIGR04138 family)